MSVAYLRPDHRTHLEGSAISDEIISERGYRTISTKQEWGELSSDMTDKQLKLPGIAFPIYRLGAAEPHTWMLRPDRPRMRYAKSLPKPIKYEYPQHKSLCVDVLPRYHEALGDPKVPLWITEGAKKADSLATHFGDRIVPANLNGVWAWRGTNEYGGKTALADFEHIALNGRQVVLAYDSDVIRKREVLQALERCTAMLSARGAKVRVLVLPETNDEKLGVDDAFARGMTTADLEQYIRSLKEAAALARTKCGVHPETHHNLYLPQGYNPTGEHIAHHSGTNSPTAIYHGHIEVTETGVDLASGHETMTVAFTGRNGRTELVTAPRADLARAKGVIEHLAARGAAVHEGNARNIAQYLSEFASENRDALPHRAHIARLGLINDGLVLPSGSVGLAEVVHYRGQRTICICQSET